MTHHEAGAGPEHGPAHRGDVGSPEPGGFDEYDHGPAGQQAPSEGSTSTVEVETAAGTDGVPGPAAGERPEGSIGGEQQDEAELQEDQSVLEVQDEERAAQLSAAEVQAAGPGDPARLAAERLEDLRRLQAEYVNYKKRVDRERMRAREQGIASTLEALMPVLDDIYMAREHGELAEGPFAAIAEKLEAVLARLGIHRFGAPGEPFDPLHHDALMHVQAELDSAATSTTVVQVLQPGYRLGDRVVRPARVAVADPQ